MSLVHSIKGKMVSIIMKLNQIKGQTTVKSNCVRSPHPKESVRQLQIVIKTRQKRHLRPLNRKRRNSVITSSNCRTACKGWGMLRAAHLVSRDLEIIKSSLLGSNEPTQLRLLTQFSLRFFNIILDCISSYVSNGSIEFAI